MSSKDRTRNDLWSRSGSDSLQSLDSLDRLRRRNRSPEQLIDHFRVAAVEIISKEQLTIADVCRPVCDEHRNFLGHANALIILRALHRGFNPTSIPPKHPLRQLRRFLDAYAAVTERSNVLLEQLAVRRVVQIDVEAVRKQELHEPE